MHSDGVLLLAYGRLALISLESVYLVHKLPYEFYAQSLPSSNSSNHPWQLLAVNFRHTLHFVEDI